MRRLVGSLLNLVGLIGLIRTVEAERTQIARRHTVYISRDERLFEFSLHVPRGNRG